MATDQKYLSKQNAARRLDCSTKTIDRLRVKGDLDWIKVGSGVRIAMPKAPRPRRTQRLEEQFERL